MNTQLKDTIILADEHLKTLIDLIQAKAINHSIEEKIIAAYILIAVNHLEAIIELIKIDKFISALALVRPNFEAIIRGTWLAVKEDDWRVKEAIRNLSENNDFFPKLWEMQNEIAEVFTIEFCDKETIKAFHNYTHGGPHLVNRCINEKYIVPQFSTDELIGVIKGVTFHTALIVLAFATKTDDRELANKIKNFIAKI
jgi:hypothetical protein